MRAEKRLTWLGLAACLVVMPLTSPDAVAQLMPDVVADLRITLVGGPKRIIDGARVKYTAVVENFGPDAATFVLVVAEHSQNLKNPVLRCVGGQSADKSCSFATLEPRQSATVELEVQGVRTPGVEHGGDAAFSLAVASRADDPTPGDNSVVLYLEID